VDGGASVKNVGGIVIEEMKERDWNSVREIYVEGMRTGNATFEAQAPEWEKWDGGHLRSCRFVAREENEILGWAALSPVSSRCAYAGVGEVSVYVSERVRGRKIGWALLRALVEASEREGIWTLQAGIFPENLASVELHKRCGFRIVGVREKVGCMNGRWRDVLLMERRSRVVGRETGR
jgi:L-amino acid N-acyltransferase YncA